MHTEGVKTMIDNNKNELNKRELNMDELEMVTGGGSTVSGANLGNDGLSRYDGLEYLDHALHCGEWGNPSFKTS